MGKDISMGNREIPWAYSIPGLALQTFSAPPPGFALRLRGMHLSCGVATETAGPGSITLQDMSALAAVPVTDVGSVPGSPPVAFSFYFETSVSDFISIPYNFGESGLVIPGSFTVNLSFTIPPQNCALNMWGAFVPIGE